MKQMWRKSMRAILDAIYPPDAVCFACNREAILDERLLCADCGPTIGFAGNLRFVPEGINGASAGFVYSEAIHACMYRFKYGDAMYLARPLAMQMCLPRGCMPDMLIPVPLHPKRLRQRGYNQSELLSRMFSEDVGIPVAAGLLQRKRATLPQGSLHREARAGNVRGAFEAKRDVAGKTILLIDDVLTTGNTLVACADALRKAGAAQVFAACACTTSTVFD